MGLAHRHEQQLRHRFALSPELIPVHWLYPMPQLSAPQPLLPQNKMPLNFPITPRALRLAKFPFPLPRGISLHRLQLYSAERHLVDPIDQLAHIFLIRVVTKLVLRIGFVAQSVTRAHG